MTYTAPGSRSTAAILALYVKVGACFLAIGADVGRIFTARGLQDGDLLVDDLLGADRLVTLATITEGLALVVALALVGRWWLVVRGNRPVLGALPRLPVVTAALVAVTVALVAVTLSWTVLGSAEDVGDRERIDALRALATALSAAATGLVIAAVAQVTRAQEQRALAVDAPRTPARIRRAEEEPEEGGLQVVSEADARRDRGEN